MFPETPSGVKCGFAAGYLLAVVGQRVLRFLNAIGAPHLAVFGTVIASVAISNGFVDKKATAAEKIRANWPRLKPSQMDLFCQAREPLE